jgi:hypothetical protein
VQDEIETWIMTGLKLWGLGGGSLERARKKMSRQLGRSNCPNFWLGNSGNHFIVEREQLLRALKQFLPLKRQPDSGADRSNTSYNRPEPFHLRTDCRLRHSERIRGSGKAAKFRQCHK